MITKLDNLVEVYILNEYNDNPKFRENGGLQNILEDIKKELIEILPHGAGIDNTWEIEKRQKLDFVCKNSFHAMDQNGGYCGYVDFEVFLNVEKIRHSLDVEVNRMDVEGIYNDYSARVEIEDKDEYEDDPTPYLDDLQDHIYQTVRAAFEYYYITETIAVAKNRGFKF